jgi:hypothetical protein
VKRWQKGDQVERWVGTGLVVAERQFRKVIGVKYIPAFLSALAAAVAQPSVPKPLAKTGKVA